MRPVDAHRSSLWRAQTSIEPVPTADAGLCCLLCRAAPSMPPPHSLLEAEVKQREIAAKLDALNQRQAARERDAGRPGVGSRAQLEKRLRELQKAKAAKKAAAAATAGGDGPSASASLFSLHSSNTADAPSSLEWAERLRQAKAKYWANLDQLAPEWKSNSQHRRLEQLAMYEQAIGTRHRGETEKHQQALRSCDVASIHVDTLFSAFAAPPQTPCSFVVRMPLWPTRKSASCKRC